MLTDFDLSLESTASPALEDARSVVGDKDDDDVPEPAPTCLPIPELQLLRLRRWKRRAAPRPRFVAEPVDARSSSFVGTHEYVAPEVARGGPHGAAVDWWALGVFLYELLHGRTPFAGADNEATLRNIARRPLSFPAAGAGDADARDLIARLLAKDPRHRLGSRRGAADVKAHPFFRGLNFALLRSSRPPVVPAASRSPLHRSQSCSAARTRASKPKPPPDTRFDLF